MHERETVLFIQKAGDSGIAHIRVKEKRGPKMKICRDTRVKETEQMQTFVFTLLSAGQEAVLTTCGFSLNISSAATLK